MMPRTPAVPADPLADLRSAEDEAQPVIATLPIQVSADMDDVQAAAAIVSAWHRDLTAQSFGHGGGTCGCTYLAKAAVQVLRA